ncbi:hypothetical protein [Clostridium neonatale]|uniref:Uncharacterized protein n=1 Tax=Clostridium neonatale TaxID=137838 RepID=A0AA86JD05_9CLOT|nr:hypothetical protein [Clostridium neonatale]MBP8314295.1 hypothetical protein [Clostridium neonatale]CAG9703977.1 conserved hypothetical protein [Clostridium neonatale]CAI3207789.1 conserved hypothetical protein [Clostridium neonatale]CAI3535749.1 conserved hypothetical protein [Clostridium neonatale]CAI3541082.1 conserved hypothetical protein [Clostridium neonatale]
MILETVIRLMRAYSTCPKCGAIMMCDDFKSDGNKASLKCKCGWKLEVKESEK